ncbi:hypothetical protein KR054_005848 [Drosophila jambulina]|nr:hypothetical protein KR054_005848 [Drosophila jambulina]
MFNWVGLLLRTYYYYGHAIGVNNFELDWQTGRVFKSTRSTLYAMANNIIIVMLISLEFIGQAKIIIMFEGMNKLYGFVVISVITLRITSGLTILLNQWRLRSQRMILARKAVQLCLASPEIIRIFRWRILLKFFNGLLIDISPFATALISLGFEFPKDFPAVVLQLWMSGILNLSAAQYFLVMFCIRGQYDLLNAQLKEVIEESKSLSYSRSRKGVFMTRCCALADQLEDIAKLQSQLQSLVVQLEAVFARPKLVMYCSYYVFSVVSFYVSYKIFEYNFKDLGLNQRDIILSFTWCFFFHADAIHNLFTTLNVQDGNQEIIQLLEERTIFGSGLDARLEESFESLQLQLIRNPLKMNVFQLFPISRKATWAMFVSMFLHTIYLVQYELENFRRK